MTGRFFVYKRSISLPWRDDECSCLSIVGLSKEVCVLGEHAWLPFTPRCLCLPSWERDLASQMSGKHLTGLCSGCNGRWCVERKTRMLSQIGITKKSPDSCPVCILLELHSRISWGNVRSFISTESLFEPLRLNWLLSSWPKHTSPLIFYSDDMTKLCGSMTSAIFQNPDVD